MKGTNLIKYLPYLVGALGGAGSATAYQKRKMRTKRRRPSTKRKTGGRAGTSRRKYTRVRKRSKVAKNTKSIRKLQQHDRQSLGDMTYRHLESYSSHSTVNAQAVPSISTARTTDLETVLAQCKFFDPSTPGTLITGSTATGNYQRNVRFENVSSSIKVANNYGTTQSVTVYLCKVKDDTSVGPGSAWSNAVADGSNLIGTTPLGQYPSDYDLVKDLWNLKVAKKVSLAPGKSFTLSHSTGAFEYSSSTVDTHSMIYQKEYKSFVWMIVHHGELGHDTVLSETAALPSGLDISYTTTYKVKYDAGINIRYIYVVNDNDTAFTNGGVMAQKPVTDNQGYSIP